jgi:CheY-like chemotaxis protein
MNNTSAPSRFKKVLIIDDDELDLYVSQRIINSSLFAETVVTATSVKDAMHYLKSNNTAGKRPDFIFLDLNMPEKNGLDFLNEYAEFLNGEKPTCTIALLMNVVNSDDAATSKAKMHPLVQRVIEKPLTVEKLRSI